MALGGIDPLFTVYSKITDRLIYFDENYSLEFCVQLIKKSKDGRPVPFHTEYQYFNKDFDQDVVNITRNFGYYLVLKKTGDYTGSVLIRPKDLPIFKIIFDTVIMPWFVGSSRVYDLIDGQLVMTRNEQQDIPLSEKSQLIFAPMIFDYSDGDSKEGCRMYINTLDNYINMSLDKFMELYYYLVYTDFYNAAINMITYVKTQPYGVNRSTRDSHSNSSYFDKR